MIILRYFMVLSLAVASLYSVLSGFSAAAQEAEAPPQTEDNTCSAYLTELWTQASDVCIGGPPGYFCSGGSTPQVQPEGAVSNAFALLGAKVEAKAVTAMTTHAFSIEGRTMGIEWLRPEAPTSISALLLGEVSIQDITPEGFPAWTSVIVQTGETLPTCDLVPENSYIVQSPVDQPVRIAVNGVSLDLNGTVVIRTHGANTHFIALSGTSNLIVFGQTQPLVTGQESIVPYEAGDFSRPVSAASVAVPFDFTAIDNLPVALFDRPVILPQPGYVRTDGQVNMRTDPSTNSGIILQVPAGEIMSVLGRNETGEWYHVRLNTGETGWMLAELLHRSTGVIETVYNATPIPPQRYGQLASEARIIAPAGVNLRQGPDVGFPAIGAVGDGTIVELIARSPYSPWVKIDINGTTGWVSLLTLQTQAYIDSLPIDHNVPPPPPPTQIPGSFGNAFPDPKNP